MFYRFCVAISTVPMAQYCNYLMKTRHCLTDCSSPEIEFTVNDKTAVHSEPSLTVGDIVTCAAEGALTYRWTNKHHPGDAITHGRAVRISQPGIFSYACSVFMECGTGMYCPLSRSITGFAQGCTPNLFSQYSLRTCNNIN